MLWIDGEYFINPIQSLKDEKTAAMMDMIAESFMGLSDAIRSTSLIGYTLGMLKADMSNAQAAMIYNQPILPHNNGGEIVRVSTGEKESELINMPSIGGKIMCEEETDE